MSVNTKRVFYVTYLSHSIFADLLGARPDVRLDQLENDSAERAIAPKEARADMGRIAAQQLLDTVDGQRPPRIVNAEACPHYARRFERAFGFAPGQPVCQLAGE